MSEEGKRLIWPRRAGVLALLLLLLLSLPARAQESAVTFESANKLYYEGKFSDAATAYEKLLQSGKASAAVYFNLGNACFKSGQIGRAIAAYRQAQRLTPRDPDVRANLQFARNQIQGPTVAPSRWQRWLSKLTLDEWTFLAMASLWLWFVLLALAQWRPALRRSLGGYASGASLAAVLLCCCLAAVWHETRLARTAIVVTTEAVVHHGPLEVSPNAFTVHDGAESQLLDEKGDWLRVSTDPRRIGWLRREQVLLGRPGGS